MPTRIRRLFRDARSWLARAPIRSKYWRSSFRAAKILCFSYGHLRSVRAASPVDAAGKPIPWYTYPAIDFLRQLDLSERTVFDIHGSGKSTLFWAARAARVGQRRRRRALVGTLKSMYPRTAPSCRKPIFIATPTSLIHIPKSSTSSSSTVQHAAPLESGAREQH